MCSNSCEFEVTCFRPESNRAPYGLLYFLSAALSTTELWWRKKYLPFSHTACEALKIVIPVLDKNPGCPSPGLLPPSFDMPLHPHNWSFLVSDWHTIFSERSTRMQHTHTWIQPVQFHQQDEQTHTVFQLFAHLVINSRHDIIACHTVGKTNVL